MYCFSNYELISLSVMQLPKALSSSTWKKYWPITCIIMPLQQSCKCLRSVEPVSFSLLPKSCVSDYQNMFCSDTFNVVSHEYSYTWHYISTNVFIRPQKMLQATRASSHAYTVIRQEKNAYSATRTTRNILFP